MGNVCKWCGDATETVRKKLCRSCKDMHADYIYRIGRLFHTTPVPTMLRFRNMCMDMQEMQRHGGKDLPHDLEYQLERVNRYLADTEKKEDTVK